MINRPKSAIHHPNDKVQLYTVINEAQTLTMIHNLSGEGVNCCTIRLQKLQFPSNMEGSKCFPQIWKGASRKSFSGYVSDKGRPERIGSIQLRPAGNQCIYSAGITFAQYWFWNFSCSFAAISDRLPY